MLFNSYEFIFLFMPFTMFVFYAFCRFGLIRAAVWWIGFASLFFYAYWNWHFVFLFIGSIVFNYFTGNVIVKQAHSQTKKRLLIFGLLVNLGLLAFFKYSRFLMQNLSSITHANFPMLNVILPIGISFFTFTQVAYLVDCMRGDGHRYSFSDYLLFVSYFPHLVAGPILRHNTIIPQIESKKFGFPSNRKVYSAVIFFSLGLFKKVVVADNLATYVDPLFANINALSTLDAWSAALFYTFQIYFDFSAYSDMAIGLALLMNMRLPFNFNSPYKAASIVDFWRRWHISLSTFLRDYLYFPLGGNRKGVARRYLNLFVTMLLGGLWHGAAWTFVIWGALHGAYLTINHAWRSTGIKLPYFVSWLVTFISVVVGWIFFRSQDFTSAISLLRKMIGLDSSVAQSVNNPFFIVISLILLTSWTLIAPNTQQIAIARYPKIRVSLFAAVSLIIGILALGQSDHFIYFQF